MYFKVMLIVHISCIINVIILCFHPRGCLYPMLVSAEALWFLLRRAWLPWHHWEERGRRKYRKLFWLKLVHADLSRAHVSRRAMKGILFPFSFHSGKSVDASLKSRVPRFRAWFLCLLNRNKDCYYVLGFLLGSPGPKVRISSFVIVKE